MKYFYRNTTIVDLPFRVKDYDKRFVALTPEQETFLLEHPEATAYEVKNMHMNEDSPEPYMSLDTIKENALSSLSNYSLNIVNHFCTPYQFANAQASLLAIANGGVGIYDKETATNYINLYNQYGKQCRDLYYEAKGYIELCNTENDINEIVIEYERRYNNIGIEN